MNRTSNSNPELASCAEINSVNSLAHITPEASAQYLRDGPKSYGETKLLSYKNLSRDGLDETLKPSPATKGSLKSIGSLQLLAEVVKPKDKGDRLNYHSNKAAEGKQALSSLQHIDELSMEEPVMVSKKSPTPIQIKPTKDKNMRYLSLNEEYSPSTKLMNYAAQSPSVMGYIEEKNSEEFDGNFSVDVDVNSPDVEKGRRPRERGFSTNRGLLGNGCDSPHEECSPEIRLRESKRSNFSKRHSKDREIEISPQDVIDHRMLNSPHRPVHENSLPSNMVNLNRVLPRNHNDIESVSRGNQMNVNNPIISQPEQGNSYAVNINQNINIQPESQEDALINRTETKLFIRRCAVFFLAMSIASMYALVMLDGKASSRGLILVLYGCVGLISIENLLRLRHPNRESWKVKEDLFYSFDFISVIISLTCIGLRVTNLVYAVFFCVPFLINGLAYSCFCQDPKGLGILKALARWMYGAQALLIITQVNGIISWDWKLALAFVWIYLGLCFPYLIAFGLMVILMLIFYLFGQRLYQSVRIKSEILGLFWFLGYYLLSVVGFMVLIGMSDAYGKHHNPALLKKATMISAVFNSLLFVYTVAIYGSLIDFLIAFNLATTVHRNSNVNDISNQSQDKIKIEVEKKESYFIMLSSTYFQPLKNGFAMNNNIEKVEEIKKTLSNFRLWRLGSYYMARKAKEEGKANINVTTLQQYKQSLDERFAKAKMHNKPGSSKNLKAKRSKRIAAILKEDEKVVESEQESQNAGVAGKMCHSEGDKENIKKFMEEGQKKRVELTQENLCYICYDAESNAVMMKCGHGGICYECALEMIQKKNECMECRAEVEMIVKVDPNPKMSDIIKAVEVSRVTKGKK